MESLLREEQRKAYINPEIAEQEKEKGNEFFRKGKSIFLLGSFIIYKKSKNPLTVLCIILTIGQYADALKCYSEAIKRNPSDAKVYSNRAACYTKLAAFDLGLKDCDVCLELEPSFGMNNFSCFKLFFLLFLFFFLVKGWIRKGKILQGMQQYSKASTAFQKAMELDPNASVV